MRVNVVLEQRFVHLPDGSAYDNGQATYAHWRRYLGAFEAVQVVGRSQLVRTVPEGYKRVDGPGVSFLPVPYYQGPVGLLRRLRSVTQVLRHLPREDAVIVRLSGVLGHLAAELRSLQRQSFAAEVVNDPYLGYGPDGTRHPLRPLFRRVLTGLTRRQCRQATAVQYVTREALQRRYPAGERTPHFGVSDVHLPPQAYGEARTYQRPAQLAVIVGTLEQRHKAVDITLRALARLRMQGLPVRLRVVGDGPLRPELEALAAELGVRDCTEFAGQRSTPEAVRADLAEADLFLIPSRTEGMPRALLEAMAQGLPAVGSDVGGIPELLPPEVLVTPGDVESLTRTWHWLAQDPEVLSRHSAQNLQLACSYADDQLDRQRLDFLRTVRAAVRPGRT